MPPATRDIKGGSLNADQTIARLESSAEVRRTPCGDGHMVWHIWGKGPNLVLLHGNLGSWMHWIRNIEFLSQHFRVIAGDIPGFGESDLPPKPYSAQSVAQIVADGLVEITGKDAPISFAGFSFGSGVAAETAKILGARVDKLVLLSAGTKMQGVTRFDIPAFVKWRGLPQPERDAAHRRNMEIMMVADPASIDELALHIHSDNAAKARLNIDVINAGASHTNVTPHLQCEVAAIWGERDSVIGPNMHERTGWLERHHPGARHAIIKGSGHWCMYEATDALNQALLDLLKPSQRQAAR
jgi:pimeloyl-ACP methyl ester carboxylesterase